jgi:hypothetical protein
MRIWAGGYDGLYIDVQIGSRPSIESDQPAAGLLIIEAIAFTEYAFNDLARDGYGDH